MNIAILTGRLTKDPNYTEGETHVARYTLAVDRYKKDEADFINCVAFGKGADFAALYLKKGTKIAVTGHIQTGSYIKDGEKKYTTDVIVEKQEFCERKATTEENPEQFTADLEGLPFN